MKIELLFLGKTKDKFLSDGIDEYLSRLRHYTAVSVKVLKNKVQSPAHEEMVREREAELLLSNASKGSYIVALDSNGRQVSSEELSSQIDKWEQRSIGMITFLIGGPFGLAEKVVNEADMVLSLSRLTFTHDMVRMLLLEQLYRGYTIKRGEKYHK